MLAVNRKFYLFYMKIVLHLRDFVLEYVRIMFSFLKVFILTVSEI